MSTLSDMSCTKAKAQGAILSTFLYISILHSMAILLLLLPKTAGIESKGVSLLFGGPSGLDPIRALSDPQANARCIRVLARE